MTLGVPINTKKRNHAEQNINILVPPRKRCPVPMFVDVSNHGINYYVVNT